MQIPFQNPLRSVPNTTGPAISGGNRYSQPPNKDERVRRLPNKIIHSLLFQIYSQRTSAYPQSRNLGTGRPKLFCTACGEYDHWRKDCPYDCHCDNCDSDSHTTHMCRATTKTFSLPLPHSPLFAFTVVVQIIGQWSAVTILEITERKGMHPVQHQTGITETSNENLL